MAETDAPPPAHADNPMLGILLRLLAMVVIGIMFALVKLAAEEGVSVIESLFWRQLTALPVILVWLISTGRLHDIRTSRPIGHAIRMVVGLFAMGLNYWAMTLLPLAEATSIGFAVPIIGTILAALLLKEDVGLYRWAAVLIGFAGVMIVIQPGGNAVDPMGAIIAFTGAAFGSLTTIHLRFLSRSERPATIVFWFSLSSLIPLGIALPYFSSAHSTEAWAYIVGLGVCGAAGQLLLTSALRFGPVSVVLPMDYSALIWAVLLGYFLFSQVPHPETWIGAPVIIAAGLFIAWREHRKGKADRTPARSADD